MTRVFLALALWAAAAPVETPEVRLLCFAPSPYTQTHDAMRAGWGILLSLERVAQENRLPLRATLYDGIPALENGEKSRALLRDARVLVIGGSTWAQGSSYYLRRFFELANNESLLGASASAWATSGGSHTGGEVVIGDTLRTLMSMGAQVFSLGQKYMVFQTGERLGTPEHQLTLLDCWYMEQFARAIALAAAAPASRAGTAELARRLGVSHEYWRNMPRDEASLAPRFDALRDRLNAAANPRSDAWRELQKRLSH